jgi:hypothetical protein
MKFRRLTRRLKKSILLLKGQSRYPYPNCIRAYALLDLYHAAPKGGAIVECGVGAGFSLGLLARFCLRDGADIYAFDSFEGFPSSFEETINGCTAKSLQGKYSSGLESVRSRLVKELGQECVENINFSKGFFDGTLVNFNRPISFLHLDVDLYESYVTCLKYLAPLCVPGAIILFDEYSTYGPGQAEKFQGAKLAIDEFCSERSLTLVKHPSGRYYIRMPSI